MERKELDQQENIVKPENDSQLAETFQLTKDLELAFSQNGFTTLNINDGADFYTIIAHKENYQGEKCEVKLVASKKKGTLNFRIDPQGEHREKYYYIREGLPMQELNKELMYTSGLLETGMLDKDSLITKIEYPDPDEFNMDDYI